MLTQTPFQFNAVGFTPTMERPSMRTKWKRSSRLKFGLGPGHDLHKVDVPVALGPPTLQAGAHRGLVVIHGAMGPLKASWRRPVSNPPEVWLPQGMASWTILRLK
jgi:hypothetical protein